MKLILKKERPISWNKFYAGAHWLIRKHKAVEIHDLVYYSLREMGIKPPVGKTLFDNRVDVIITAFFANRPLDADNIPAKLYIDGMIGTVIKNDGEQFVRSVTTRTEIDKNNPRVEIEVKEAN